MDFNCKVCKNTRMIEKEGYAERCRCVAFMNFEKFYDWSEASPKHKRFLNQLKDLVILFETTESSGEKKFHPVMMKEELDLLIQNRDGIIKENMKLFLIGESGRGKTQFAVTLGMEILKHMDLKTQEININRFFFFNPMSLINENKLFGPGSAERREEILRKIEMSDVLILDELAEELELNQIINGQLSADKRVSELHRLLKYILDVFEGLLIITSNSNDPETLYNQHNKKLSSRLFTTGTMSSYSFVNKGEDERSKKQSLVKKQLESRFQTGGDEA